MGDVPDKPDPTGLIKLSRKLLSKDLGPNTVPIGYIGDTVADVLTIQRAREEIPTQKFLSFAVVPPHLHKPENSSFKMIYERQLKRSWSRYSSSIN